MLLLAGCQRQLRLPTVELAGVGYAADSLRVHLRLTNQERRALTLLQASYAVTIGTETLASGYRANKLTLLPGRPVEAEFPLAVNLGRVVGHAITGLGDSDTVVLRLEGEYQFQTLLGQRTGRFADARHWPLREGVRSLLPGLFTNGEDER